MQSGQPPKRLIPANQSRAGLVTAPVRFLGCGLLALRAFVVGSEDAVEAARVPARWTVRLDALFVEKVVEGVALLRRLRRGHLLLALDGGGRLLDVLGRNGSGRRLGDGPLHLLGTLRFPFLIFADPALAGRGDLVLVQAFLGTDDLVFPLELLV